MLKNAGVETFRPEPSTGRVFTTRRIVRSTEVTSSGRLRLDSLARYLQIAAEDDLADSGLADPVVWLVRRCELRIRRLPPMGERLTITTYCSGTGARWAERTTTVSDPDGAIVQACAVWTAVSQADGRPVALSAEFRQVYGPSAGERAVSVRLRHPRPDPAELASAGPDGSLRRRDWPLRSADFDTAGHVNNAVHWAAVEDELVVTGWVPAMAEIEYPRAIEPGTRPVLAARHAEAETLLWLLEGDRILASALLVR